MNGITRTTSGECFDELSLSEAHVMCFVKLKKKKSTEMREERTSEREGEEGMKEKCVVLMDSLSDMLCVKR